MSDVSEGVNESFRNLIATSNELETHVKSLDKTTELDSMSTMDQAKLNVSIAYSLNAVLYGRLPSFAKVFEY